jgi:hypothetical protein
MNESLLSVSQSSYKKRPTKVIAVLIFNETVGSSRKNNCQGEDRLSCFNRMKKGALLPLIATEAELIRRFFS